MAMTDDGVAAAAASLTIATMNLITASTKVAEPEAETAVNLVEQIYRNMQRLVKDSTDKRSIQTGTMDLSDPTV